MDKKQPLSLFLVAILALSVFTMVGISGLRLQSASAQTGVTIETSADDHDNTFFTGMLQVIIEDTSTDDSAADSIDVDVTVSENGGDEDSGTLTIDNTHTGSQKFEFFLVHTDAAISAPADPVADSQQTFTFGDGAGDFDVPGFELFDDGTIEITYRSQDITIDYDESSGELTLDRDSYGSTSTVHVFIVDQDGNLDPTVADDFDVSDTNLNDVLFDITGGQFIGNVTFEETGDNTAKYEADVPLSTVFDASSDTVTLTLNDMKVYTDVTDVNNDSTDTSPQSFDIDDNDGEVDDIGALTFGSELSLTVRDNDQNLDSEDTDRITGAVTVESQGPGGDSEEIDLKETGKNTGVFQLDLGNKELRISFLNDTADPIPDNGILELTQADIDEDILIEYDDPLNDDSVPETVASFVTQLDITPGAITAPSEVGVNDEFTATLTDPDLNDDKRTRDSYTILWTGEATDLPLLRGGNEYGDMYDFSFEVDGQPLDFGSEEISLTLRETGVDTGVFEFDIDMKDISEFGDGGDALSIDDGSDLQIFIDDNMKNGANDPDEDDVRVTVGKPNVGVDFSRTSVPIPPETGSKTEARVGDTAFTTMVVTDPERANQTSVQETFPIVFNEDSPGKFSLEVDGDDVNHLTITSMDDNGESSFEGDTAGCDGGGSDNEPQIVDGVSLCEVLDISDDLEETGKATGIFESQLAFTNNADMDARDWQDAEFTFTYFDTSGDDESGGVTFRGNDGIVTVDQPSAKAGTSITITVEDQDLNLDDTEIDTFTSANNDDAEIDQLLLIETEDDEISDLPDTDTFRETGEDTGVFEATFVVGDDIPITEQDGDQINQATNILITYDDEIDSTGGNGDEIEANVPIASGTGSIQVTPELVGPATELTVLIADTDLDEDAHAIDEYNTVNGDNFVTFSSSRNEVDEASPDIEETGPNTGVFMFKLQLETDEQACQDDDLGASEFQASGDDTDSTIGACPGDLIAIKYDDEMNANGRSTTVSAVVEVNSYDPEFAADKDAYNVGDRPTITISDPDANRDADVADSLTGIRVTSDSDRVGEEFSALETGRDTGVFRLTFGTSEGSQGGSISVTQGDDVTVKYTDDFPADFVDQEEDKDFEFVISFEGVSGPGKTTVTAPELHDVSGNKLTEVSAGQQVVLTTNVLNKSTSPTPFVALIEVRDDNGVTVYLAWQTGSLNPNGQAQVGLSWTPDVSGNYQVRTFVISDLAHPQVLSEVATSNITVS
jgi:hypothetical protein